MQDCYAYISMFGAAFLAATLFPAQSELLLAGLVSTRSYSLALLLGAATLGNVSGSTVNWALGRYFNHLSAHSWFPLKRHRLNRAELWYRKYGRWTLLLSWLPVIGDPITLTAGMLRESFIPFLVIVSIAKLSRYLVVAAAALGWAS